MKKLSKAQQEVIDGITKEINEAKQCSTIEEYIEKFSQHYSSFVSSNANSRRMKEEKGYDYIVPDDTVESFKKSKRTHYDLDLKWYENKKNNICLCWANSRTIKKLEEMGLIEIIKDGGKYPDTVRLIENEGGNKMDELKERNDIVKMLKYYIEELENVERDAKDSNVDVSDVVETLRKAIIEDLTK